MANVPEDENKLEWIGDYIKKSPIEEMREALYNGMFNGAREQEKEDYLTESEIKKIISDMGANTLNPDKTNYDNLKTWRRRTTYTFFSKEELKFEISLSKSYDKESGTILDKERIINIEFILDDNEQKYLYKTNNPLVSQTLKETKYFGIIYFLLSTVKEDLEIANEDANNDEVVDVECDEIITRYDGVNPDGSTSVINSLDNTQPIFPDYVKTVVNNSLSMSAELTCFSYVRLIDYNTGNYVLVDVRTQIKYPTYTGMTMDNFDKLEEVNLKDHLLNCYALIIRNSEVQKGYTPQIDCELDANNEPEVNRIDRIINRRDIEKGGKKQQGVIFPSMMQAFNPKNLLYSPPTPEPPDEFKFEEMRFLRNDENDKGVKDSVQLNYIQEEQQKILDTLKHSQHNIDKLQQAVNNGIILSNGNSLEIDTNKLDKNVINELENLLKGLNGGNLNL